MPTIMATCAGARTPLGPFFYESYHNPREWDKTLAEHI